MIYFTKYVYTKHANVCNTHRHAANGNTEKVKRILIVTHFNTAVINIVVFYF